MMFLAIENMASAYGYKQSNTRSGDKNKNKNNKKKNKKGGAPARKSGKDAIYQARRALAEAVDFDPEKDDSVGDFIFCVKMFAEQNKDKCRYGVAGSLNSLLKRIAIECKSGGMTFDTLVFAGHGNTGVMTVGMGCTPLGKMEQLKQPEHQAALAGLQMDRRMINVQNTQTWQDMFKAHRECFTPSRLDDTFHVIFAGCSTGNMSESSYRHLTHVVAEQLSSVLGCRVNAYGTDDEIVNDDILDILKSMGTIKTSATGANGSYRLPSGVSLDWIKKG
ncbi:hypothetical protein JR065_02280 [Xanthomonas sp. AmX2]|uniref:hypothetical protein n=1 Tax=Xanthomonas sp. TaxID=29446 RepID=UPI00197DC23D|nr:hypothetical protein [Xanthomonas sp.]MBN6149155.1 hypothetical protein [Xanthomonas sp.]